MDMVKKVKRVGAYRDIGRLFLKYGLSDELKKNELCAEFSISETVEPSAKAEDFTRDLERLGPSFIKVGQLLSTRPDLLPRDWIAALQRLQDKVEPFPFEQVKAIIESELGGKISLLFESFDESPLAAASIGQVHVAKLRDSGRKVAVKIQRPGIRTQMAEELDAIVEAAGWVERFSQKARRYEVKRVAEQFKNSIIHELNYEEEIANLIQMKDILQDSPNLVVPEVIPDYSSNRVLTMEYISGTKITDLSGVVHVDLNGEALADELFASYLTQVLVEGFFHADPHPGNLLLTTERKIAVLDLGLVLCQR